MNAQPVVIHGQRCLLMNNGGGSMNSYTVVRCASGALITQQPSRLLAVARAAEVLRTQRS